MEAYTARFLQMYYQCGPGSWQYLLASPAEVAASPPASRLRVARTHPDTHALLPLPFCMAAHVPCNAVLLLGMLTARSPVSHMAWQSLNQLFNAAQFYANRNASNPVSDTRLALSLAASTASAVAVAAGLHSLAAGGRRPLLLAAVPFLGAAAAKPLQVGCLRWDEYAQGVEVRDAYGQVRGRSARAGAWGVTATVLTRVLYLAPMLWMPHAQAALQAALLPARWQRSWAACTALYLAHAAFTSAVVTPACIALFEQRQGVRAGWLEAELRGTDLEETLYFNKGL